MLFDIIKKLNIYGASLIAVSKTQPREQILKVYHQGQKAFGENRVQELIAKRNDLPDDIEWHLIGHLQTNKVKHIVGYITMIQSVDSMKLLHKIQAEAQKIDRVVPILLQIHIARETNKYGFDFDELIETFRFTPPVFSHIKICGVMGMASFTTDEEVVRSEFKLLKTHFLRLKEDLFQDNPEFKEISMGMSGDYPIALEEGATMVRIGSLIFGPRH